MSAKLIEIQQRKKQTEFADCEPCHTLQSFENTNEVRVTVAIRVDETRNIFTEVATQKAEENALSEKRKGLNQQAFKNTRRSIELSFLLKTYFMQHT